MQYWSTYVQRIPFMLSRIVRECLTDSYKSDTTSVFWLCHMNKCILIIKMHSPFGMNMENLCLHRFPCHSTSFSNWKSKNRKGVKFCHKLIYNLQKFSWNGGKKEFPFLYDPPPKLFNNLSTIASKYKNRIILYDASLQWQTWKF